MTPYLPNLLSVPTLALRQKEKNLGGQRGSSIHKRDRTWTQISKPWYNIQACEQQVSYLVAHLHFHLLSWIQVFW